MVFGFLNSYTLIDSTLKVLSIKLLYDILEDLIAKWATQI